MKATLPLRHLVTCLDGRRVPLNSEQRSYMEGQYPYWGAGSIVDHIDQYLFDEELVLLGEDGAPFFDNARDVAFRVNERVWVNNHIHVLRPSTAVDARYLTYALNVVDYGRYIGGSTRDKLTQDDMREIQVPSWSVGQQRRIADFLDDQVARIDNIIAARSRQLDLETEAFKVRRDDITLGRVSPGPRAHAIWPPFGTVPTEWNETLLRSVSCTIQTGPFGSQLHSDEYVDDGWPVVNPAGLKESRIVRVPGMAISDAVRTRLERHILHAGDVVFGRRGELGRAALVTAGEDGWVLGTGSLMVRLPVDSPLNPGYLVRLLATAALRFYFDSVAVGSTMANLNVPILAAMPILLPSANIQRRVIQAVADIDRNHRESSSAFARSVDLFEDLKRSLISAAVSGEFDVTSTDGSRVVA